MQHMPFWVRLPSFRVMFSRVLLTVERIRASFLLRTVYYFTTGIDHAVV